MKTEQLLKAGEFAEKASKAVAAARKLGESVAQAQTKAAEITPAVLTRLQDLGLVSDVDLPAVREKLASHAGTLEVLGHLAAIYGKRVKAAAAAQPPVIGSGIPDGPLEPEVIPTGVALGPNDVRPSDLPFMRMAGIR